MKLGQGVGDQNASMRPQAIVVKVQVLQGDMLGEECNQGRLGVQAESIVVQVYRAEVGQVKYRGKQGGQRLGDFAEQAAGEDIGKVCDLNARIYRSQRGRERMRQAELMKGGWESRTCSDFLVAKTSPRRLQAPIPRVLPSNLTSSTSSMAFRSPIWASKSSAVSSFKPFPSREKTLVDGAILASSAV